nr:GNAT family N-acetyltransferase [Rhizobium halophytocola]
MDLILSSFAYMNGVIDPPSSALALTPDSLAAKARAEIVFLASGADGELLGCIFCRPEPPTCLYIGKLAVLPQAQGQGLGRDLMQRAEGVARGMGLPALRLETRIELTGNHLRFGRMGFQVTAEGRHKGFDRTTFIEMHKAIAG